MWAGVIFYMSTRTFGHALSDRLLRDALAFFHLKLSYHHFHLLATGFRKMGHFTEYFVFSIFLYYALGGGRMSPWNPRKALGCILLAGLYSLTDEFHQRFVPGRGASIADCGLDTMSATLGMAVVYFTGKSVGRTAGKAPQGTPDGGSSLPS